jgi:anti-sigma factor RsiW
MTDRLPTDEDLNAYVDGELSPHDRARVAHAVAADAALADRVAALARLKSVVAGIAEERPVTLGDIGLATHRRRTSFARFAASVAIVTMLASIAAGSYWGWRVIETDTLVAEAKTRHLAWLSDAADSGPEPDFSTVLNAAMRRLEGPAHVPDFASAKLTLSDVVYFDQAAAPTVQLRYTGRRGCRVSLWLSHGPSPLDTSLTETEDAQARGFYWRVGDVSYALFATGMDTRRFTLLARNAYEATRDNREPPEPHRRELRVATDGAAPCRA